MLIDINILIVIVGLSLALTTFFAILAIYRAANQPTRTEIAKNRINSMMESEIEADDYDLPDEEKKKSFPSWSDYWLSLYRRTGRNPEDPKLPGRIPLILGAIGLAFGGFVYPGDVFGGIIGTLLLVLIPYFIFNFEASRRAKTLDKQLPYLLNTLRSNLQGSLSPQAALIEASQEVPAPLGDELKRVKSDIELNIPLWEALRKMSQRVDSHDIKFTLSAIEISIVEGSDLDLQLQVIQDITKQRVRIRQRLEAAIANAQPALWISSAAIPLSMMFSIYSNESNKSFWFSGLGILVMLVVGMLYLAGLFISRLLVRNIEKA